MSENVRFFKIRGVNERQDAKNAKEENAKKNRERSIPTNKGEEMGRK